MMKFVRSLSWVICMSVLILTVSCRSNSGLKKESSVPVSTELVSLANKVLANAQTSPSMTAKVKVRLQLDNKDVSLSGTLRMHKDDVIQLSLTAFLGFEVGRMEFLQDQVLIVDRFHRQYIKVPYKEVDFLNKTGINFHMLQSLFWAEVFAPGNQDVAGQWNRFDLEDFDGQLALSLKREPALNYKFQVQRSPVWLERTTITPKDGAEAGAFECCYGDYSKFRGKYFPSSMDMSFSGEGVKVRLLMNLKNIDDNDDWEKRTSLSSKYRQMDAKGILKKFLSKDFEGF